MSARITPAGHLCLFCCASVGAAPPFARRSRAAVDPKTARPRFSHADRRPNCATCRRGTVPVLAVLAVGHGCAFSFLCAWRGGEWAVSGRRSRKSFLGDLPKPRRRLWAVSSAAAQTRSGQTSIDLTGFDVLRTSRVAIANAAGAMASGRCTARLGGQGSSRSAPSSEPFRTVVTGGQPA